MQVQDLERIARAVLRELGAGDPPVIVSSEARPDRWKVEVGGKDPITLTIRAGSGTTPQFIRDQIFNQLRAR